MTVVYLINLYYVSILISFVKGFVVILSFLNVCFCQIVCSDNIT